MGKERMKISCLAPAVSQVNIGNKNRMEVHIETPSISYLIPVIIKHNTKDIKMIKMDPDNEYNSQ